MDPLVLAAQLTIRQFHPYDRVYYGEDKYRSGKRFYLSGVHACYRRLNSKWGFKIFTSEKQRDGNYETHMILLKEGLGPKMGLKFNATTKNKQKVYGFITEHCPKVFREAIQEGLLSYQKASRFREIVNSKYPRIDDIHNGNCAMLSDGRMVVIDVSFNYVENGEVKENYDDFNEKAGRWYGNGSSHKLEELISSGLT